MRRAVRQERTVVLEEDQPVLRVHQAPPAGAAGERNQLAVPAVPDQLGRQPVRRVVPTKVGMVVPEVQNRAVEVAAVADITEAVVVDRAWVTPSLPDQRGTPATTVTPTMREARGWEAPPELVEAMEAREIPAASC